jgi:hypothetical protein
VTQRAWSLRWIAVAIVAVLAAGCAGTVAASRPGADTLASTRSAARREQPVSASASAHHSLRCPANLGFPLCPLPLPGFPKAAEEMALVYREIKMRPLPNFGLQTPLETERGIPNHVLQIEYGVEHLGYPYSNPCEHGARRVSIRGDAHASACIEEGAGPVILAALWQEMGTSWQVTLSSNATRPYTIPELVKIINGWSTTGERPLAAHR